MNAQGGNTEEVQGNATSNTVEEGGVLDNTSSTVGYRDNWPSFWLNYEGGYESEQRDSEDEGSLDESDIEEFKNKLQPHLRLRKLRMRKKIKYPFFNEDMDMSSVYFAPGLKFTSRKEINDGPSCEYEQVWQIKSIQPLHTCSRTFKNRLITENWVAHEFLDKILRNPKMKPREICEEITANYKINVTLRKYQRAKDKALNAIEGLMARQYGLLKPYVNEICRSNEGSTCVLKVVGGGSRPCTFQRIYVCFSALRDGFVKCCRPIFGLDGCFLKHACGGQLLCAVGRDDGEGWTVLSDQQKGLVPAIHKIWSSIEHRQCARHIYSNWRKIHGGRQLQRVDNNMSETFNSFILLARYIPIISMLEDIRLALMDRMQEKRKLINRFVDEISPRIQKRLKDAYNEQINCVPHWNGSGDESGFEVIHRGVSHEVHLGNRTCSCREWELTVIPCAHAISAIMLMRHKPEDYIAHWYKSENYVATYANLLNPVEGSRF
ncbi:uncharacterized protein LOC109838572 [Asparagus officinalis]|uniref:uncharacterized protein LOC109838572 n=1 Tax=Asparagus officinalis TaxID=4686 RepID=UPI00098E5660|nr:uncharacterized protein LOC109838572 [Asparagus officinalis]